MEIRSAWIAPPDVYSRLPRTGSESAQQTEIRGAVVYSPCPVAKETPVLSLTTKPAIYPENQMEFAHPVHTAYM